MSKRKAATAVTAASKKTKTEAVEDVQGAPLFTTKAFVGRKAPDFTVPVLQADGKEGSVSLSDYEGRYLVLFFYPADFTFVCPTEIVAFSDRIAEFEKLNCSVLGGSTDGIFVHDAWVKTQRKQGGLGQVTYPLFADRTGAMSRDYGVLMEDNHLTHRGLFILNKQGVVQHITINIDPLGRNVDEVLRCVEALQFAEQNGVVCPAGWRKGQKTITPGPESKLAYFASV